MAPHQPRHLSRGTRSDDKRTKQSRSTGVDSDDDNGYATPKTDPHRKAARTLQTIEFDGGTAGKFRVTTTREDPEDLEHTTGYPPKDVDRRADSKLRRKSKTESRQNTSTPSSSRYDHDRRNHRKDSGYGSANKSIAAIAGTSDLSHGRRKPTSRDIGRKRAPPESEYDSDLDSNESLDSSDESETEVENSNDSGTEAVETDATDHMNPPRKTTATRKYDDPDLEDETDDELSNMEVKVMVNDNKASPVKAILDTGTSRNWISNDFRKSLKLKMDELSSKEREMRFVSFDNKEFGAVGKVELKFYSDEFADFIRKKLFFVARDAGFSMLIGRNTISKEKLLSRNKNDPEGDGALAGVQSKVRKAEKEEIKKSREVQEKIAADREKKRKERQSNGVNVKNRDQKGKSVASSSTASANFAGVANAESRSLPLLQKSSSGGVLEDKKSRIPRPTGRK